MRELETNTASAPVLRHKFSDADFAALAHDDTQSLSAGERAIRSIGFVGTGAAEGTWQLNRGIAGSARAVLRTAAPLMDPAGRLFEGDRYDPENDNPLRKWSQVVARIAQADQSQIDRYGIASPSNSTTGEFGKMVQSGIASLQQNLLLMPFAIEANAARGVQVASSIPSVRSLLPMGASTGGGAYEDAKAKGLSDARALSYGVSQGGVEMATEALPLGKWLEDTKLGSSLWKKLGKQMIAENASEQVATHTQDLLEWSELNPDKTFGDYLKDRPNAALQTLVATTVAAGLQTAPMHYAEHAQIQQNRAEQADQAHTALQQLQGVAQQSKLAERAPDVLASFMQEVADKHGAGEVQIEARVFNQALEAANIDPVKVVAKLPTEVQESYAQAVETGGDVVIPTGEAVAKLLTNEEGNALVPHMKFGPDAMSFAEREEFQTKQAERFKEDASKALEEHADDQAWQESAAKVETLVRDQLLANGAAPDAANKQAALHKAFASVMASRIGITPEQFHAQAPLAIERSTEGPQAKGFMQRMVDTVMRAAGQKRNFKTDERGFPRPVTGTEDIQAAISPIIANSRNFPNVMVLKSSKQLKDGDERQRAVYNWIKSRQSENDVAGVMHGGQMYLFGDNIRSPEQAREVILHEGAHYGLRGLMDEQTLGALMGQIRESNPQIAEDAERYAMQYDASLTEATEEVLASWAEKNEMSSLKGWDKIVAMVREWLRKLGVSREWTDNDVRMLLVRAQEYYRNPPKNDYASMVRKGERVFKQSVKPEALPATINVDGIERPTTNSKGQPIHPTREGVENFWRWFGDSKVVDADGRPLVVYHGTGSDFSKFDPEQVGKVFSDDQEGFFFSGSALEASRYAEHAGKNGGGNVMPVYLRMSKPYTFSDYAFNFAEKDDADAITDGRLLIDWVDREKDAFLPIAKEDGFDGVFLKRRTEIVAIALTPEQIKSATGNAGTFDGASPNILKQTTTESLFEQRPEQVRGTFNPDTNTITLTPHANLSTFLHESGHYFLETFMGAAHSPISNDGLRADAQRLMDWFCIRDRAEWDSLTFEEKTAYHEQFAEGFEKYLMEGKAPSIELQGAFRAFRAWLVQVYRSLRGLKAELSDEVRGVMDRMLATEEDIKSAEYARSMLPLFDSPQQAGMDAEQLKALHDAQEESTQEAIEKLQARGVRDLKWLRGAQSKTIKALQKEADGLREQETMEARREVMSQPVYQVWQWLKGRIEKGRESTPVAPRKSDPAVLDPTIDPMLTAIAKLGGIERESAVEQWGLKPEEKPRSGVFGKPVLRAKGQGYSIREMAVKLAEHGYLGDVADVETMRDFEEKFFDALSGSDSYSVQFEHQQEVRPGEADVLATDGVGRLDRASLREMYGTKHPIIQHLEALRMVRKDGVHPDVLAELFGFASGDEMVRQLAVAQDPEVEAKALADQRMLEKHGDLATPEAIQQAADEAVHNEARARFVSAELNALATISKHQKIPAEAAKAYADGMIARLKVRNLKPGQYAAAAARAGRAAEDAMRSGDTAKAMAEKRNQLIQTYAAQAAFEAKAEAKKIADQFKAIATGKDENIAKSRDMDVVNIIRAALDPFGFSGAKAEKAGRYLEVLAKRDEVMADVARDVLTTVESIAKPLPELTMEELRGLRDEIDRLWYLAQRNKRMEVDGNLLDRQDVAIALHERMEAIGIPEAAPGEGQAISDSEKRMLKFRGFLAGLKRMEAWTERMDGAQSFGPFRRFLFQQVKDGADRYRTRKAEVLGEVRRVLDPIKADMKRAKIAAPELGYTFGNGSGGVAMNELLHALLHTGNESNKRKLLLGRNWAKENADGSLDTSRWDSFVHRLVAEGMLTRAHFDAVQKVWDALESLKPDAQKAHRDVFGRYFDEITAVPFSVTFPGGETVQYRGGYAPARTDANLVQDQALRKMIEEGKEGMAFAFPTTPKGFTKSRVEYNRPLLLDLNSILQHVDQVLRFSHLEVPVREVQRLIQMPQVGPALERISPKTATHLILPWLGTAARQTVSTPQPGAEALNALATAARRNTGMALMFANVSNAMQQAGSFTSAVSRVGWGNLLEAAALHVAHPVDMYHAVMDASPAMKTRLNDSAGHLAGEVEDILLNPNAYQSAQNFTLRHGYFAQQAVETAMIPIIWTAAHNKAVQDGANDTDAVRLADAAVRLTQGSTLPEDVSAFETGTPFFRLFSQFYGYFNNKINYLVSEIAKANGDKVRIASVLINAYVAEAVITEAIAMAYKGGAPDDDKDGEYLDDWLLSVFGKSLLKTAVAAVPFGGAVSQAVGNAVVTAGGGQATPNADRLSLSPAVGMLESTFRAVPSVARAIREPDHSQAAVKDSAAALSLFTGLPFFAAGRPLGWLAGVSDGKIDPAGPVDSARGLVTGTASPESKRR